MAVTYGFYDSLNHDRLYNAQQMSAIFDGIINDGVFMSVGNQFHTVAGTGMQVIVKSGRAWFNSTWTLNDAEYPLSIDAADVLLTRIDAVVLEVNSEVATRANTIKVVKGTPASTPTKPTLTNTATVHQHALAYVTVAKNITAITNSMIEIVVGKTETPYVTAILQTTDITDLFKKWENDFQVWFETVRSTLDGDIALNLQNQIDALTRSILKDDTKTAMGLPSSAVGDDAFKYLLHNDIAKYRYIEFLHSTTWTAPSNIQNNTIKVLCCGGGGGGGGSEGGGGGSGYISIKDISIEPGKVYNIIIGSGGEGGSQNGNGHNGGTTIFGDNLVIAIGGSGGSHGYNNNIPHGGNGNAGGGSGDITGGGRGGNGSTYGGGGGGWSGGGNGGKYGGGGGSYISQGAGKGGAYGGDGSAGNDVGENAQASNGKTLDISDLLFPYNLSKEAIGGYSTIYSGILQGGGGGGFGGNGGNSCGGGGGFGGNGGNMYGGGGGFGGNGGNGGNGNNTDGWHLGGGGGGYFGDGGGINTSLRKYISASRGGGGGGGEEYGYSGNSGGSGVCALMYYVNDSGGLYE